MDTDSFFSDHGPETDPWLYAHAHFHSFLGLFGPLTLPYQTGKLHVLSILSLGRRSTFIIASGP
jgi:hypothetical protein